jgi:hypothetical protein
VVKTFADGALVETYNGAGPIGDQFPALNALTIGGEQSSAGHRFNGFIDEVRVWTAARADVDVAASYNTTLVGNAITCDAKDYPPDAGCSGALTGYGDFGPVIDNTIQANLFMASISGYCAYGGSTRTKPYSDASGANIKFVDNVFQRGTKPGQWGKPICAYWGPITDFDGSKPGAVWTGNQYDDGTPIPASYVPWEDK